MTRLLLIVGLTSGGLLAYAAVEAWLGLRDLTTGDWLA